MVRILITTLRVAVVSGVLAASAFVAACNTSPSTPNAGASAGPSTAPSSQPSMMP